MVTIWRIGFAGKGSLGPPFFLSLFAMTNPAWCLDLASHSAQKLWAFYSYKSLVSSYLARSRQNALERIVFAFYYDALLSQVDFMF
jgi:hypothetical protein